MEDERLQLQDEDAAQAQARELLGKLALCLRLATIHDLKNAAMGPPVEQLVSEVDTAFEHHDVVHVQAVGENIYLNHDLVRLSFSTFEAALTLRKIYKRLGIAELGFTARVTSEELITFLAVFQRHFRGTEPGKIVLEQLPSIVMRAIEHARPDDVVGAIDERQNVLRHFARLVVTTDDAVRALVAARPPRLARLRRALQSLADASLGHESLLVGLTRFPNVGGELSQHLAAVTAMVMLMVRRLGASRTAMSEACMSAVLHDVGRGVEDDAFSDAERQVSDLLGTQRDVAMKSMLAVCKRNISPRALAYAAVAYEHCLSLKDHDVSAVARIIAVPCAFDLMTAPSLGQRRLLPDQAMRVLFDNAPGRYDMSAVRLFAHTVGLLPVGTTVRLNGGELAVVMEVPSDAAHYAEPRVKVIRDGGGAAADYVVDLAEAGRSMRIEATVDAVEEGVNVAGFLLG